MKASELMIGDLVLFDGIPKRLTLWDIVEISRGNYNIEPIPLTEKILKAIGFSYDSAKEYLELRSNDEHGYFYIDYGFDITRLRIITDKYRCGFDINMDIAFVHQLQHALRLCGLTDLADNFKVN